MNEQNQTGRSGARSAGQDQGVLTLTCAQCGFERFVDSGPPPANLSCEKCGGTVFRSFFSPAPASDAARDFEESTARDTRTDQASSDTRPGDLLDLERE
jgi:hypothetical protein